MKITLNNLNIAAISSVVPKNKVSISSFYDRFGKNEVDRISRNTGIKYLRIAPRNYKTSDFCIASAKHLFAMTGMKNNVIDAIIFVSQTSDYRMPATSCIIQNRLGLSKNSLAFDINYGCSGYIYGLYQAALLISSNSCRKVLLCVGDTMTQHLDPHDQKTQLILGDAASATLIEKGCNSWSFDIRTDGSGYKNLIIDKKENNLDGYLQMDGAAIMEFALREVPEVIESVIREKTWSKDNIDQVIFHQANTFILNYLRKKTGFSKDKVPIAVENYGNTGPASISLTLSHYADMYKTKKLNKVVIAGFGVGLSWGAVALSLKETNLINVIEV